MSFLLQVDFSPVYDSVLNDTTLDAFTLLAMDKMVGIASAMIGSFVILRLGWEYLKYSLNSVNDSSFVGKMFDMTEAARILTLVFVLSLYSTLIGSFMGTFRMLNQATQVTDATAQQSQEVLNKYGYYNMTIKKTINSFGDEVLELGLDEDGVVASGDTKTDDSSWWDNLTGWASDFFIADIINSIFYGITSFIFYGMSSYVKIILKILIIIGPLAIAMSVLWKEKMMSWFNAFLNTGLVFVVLNTLNYLVLNYLSADFHAFDGSASMADASNSIWKSISFNVAIMGAYFSVFRLTALWAGQSLAGAIISKGLGFAGMVAGLALMGAGALKGGGGGKGGGGAVKEATSKEID